MIHKIINVLLIPFKVSYIKLHFSRSFKPHYLVVINVGTILKPVWFTHPWRITEDFKDIYVTYKVTKTYYEFIENRPYNDDGNCNTVDLHEQLIKEA
jgi:hypothetical protein